MSDLATPQPPSAESPPLSLRGLLIATWGVGGVLLLLLQAILRLGGLSLDAWNVGLDPLQMAVATAWIVFNAYGEGYRAFQKRFSPRVVVRALHLARNPVPLHVALAPAYCMALFHADRRARIVAWSTTAMVVCFIVLLRRVSQPWRGIVDAGVVVALVWGALAILVFFLRAVLVGKAPSVAAALPGGPDPASLERAPTRVG